jgi:hypothetical protein
MKLAEFRGLCPPDFVEYTLEIDPVWDQPHLLRLEYTLQLPFDRRRYGDRRIDISQGKPMKRLHRKDHVTCQHTPGLCSSGRYACRYIIAGDMRVDDVDLFALDKSSDPLG